MNNNYLTTSVIALLVGTLVCILIAGWIAPPISAVRVVSEYTCGADSFDALAETLELASWAPVEIVEVTVAMALKEGYLKVFEIGDVVFPTGVSRYWGVVELIEVTTNGATGKWWVPKVHTRR